MPCRRSLFGWIHIRIFNYIFLDPRLRGDDKQLVIDACALLTNCMSFPRQLEGD